MDNIEFCLKMIYIGIKKQTNLIANSLRDLRFNILKPLFPKVYLRAVKIRACALASVLKCGQRGGA